MLDEFQIKIYRLFLFKTKNKNNKIELVILDKIRLDSASKIWLNPAMKKAIAFQLQQKINIVCHYGYERKERNEYNQN